METTISNFINENEYLSLRYGEIALYFVKIEDDDLNYISEDTILDCVDISDKLLVSIFLRKYFYDIIPLEVENEYDLLKVGDLIKEVQGLEKFYPLISVFRDISIGELKYLDYDIILKATPRTQRILMSLFLNKYGNMIEDNKDLSIKSMITDRSIGKIEDIAIKNDECLDLSRKDIGKTKQTDGYIITCLNDKWKYVNICKTTLASYERKDFFKKLSLNHFRKLIFIEKVNINRYSWKRMVENENYYDTIIDTHKKYYDEYNTIF